MSERTKAEVRISSLQYRAVYSKPAIGQWRKSAELAQALFEVFREWGVSLENFTTNRSPNDFSQIELNIQQFLQGRYTFRIGLDAASLSIWNPDWAEISTVKRVASAGVETVRGVLGTDLSDQQVVLDIHLAPQGRSRLEIASRFVPPDLKPTQNDFEGYGFVLHRKNRLWHMDLSAHFPDALYLRLSQSFGSAASLDEIASALQQEEAAFLNFLNLSIPGFP